MKYPFKREVHGGIEVWSSTNYDLWLTLYAALSNAFDVCELADFCRQAVRDAMPLRNEPEMLFWGYDEPFKMPSDAACEFFNLPCYLMVQMMIVAINSHPQLLEQEDVRDVLAQGLNGCAWCGLAGHGYDSMSILLENLTMFTKAGMQKFLRNHSDVAGKFGKMYVELIEQVRYEYENGKHIFDWQRDFTKEQRELLWLYDSMEKDLL